MTTTSTETTTATSEDGAATTEATTTEAPAAATEATAGSVDQLPDWAQKEIRQARDEAAKSRTSKNDATKQAAEQARSALAQELGQLLGLVEGDKPPSVEKLTKDLTEQKQTTDRMTTELREARAELVVWRNATDLGIDAGAVTDSRAFERALADLDPAAKTFAEDVKKAAQAAAEQNPKLKAAQAAGKSGAELNGGTGEGAITQEKFQKMTGAERNELARRDPNLYARLSGRA